jgi:hypothetical protein
MRAIRNVSLVIGCALLASAMAASVSADLITGTQYTYTGGGGPLAASEQAFTGGVYTSTAASSGVLKDGYITTQADIEADAANNFYGYYTGNGPAGRATIYGANNGPSIDFQINGNFDLSSMLVGYVQREKHGVEGPASISVAVNGGAVVQTYTGFDHSAAVSDRGDARTYSIDLSSLSLTNVHSVQVQMTSASEWMTLNEIQFDGTAVPEPATSVLLSVGVVGLLAYAWRRRK